MVDYASISRAAERRARRVFVTPEGVDLSLRLADPGQRFGAFVIDLMIMLAVLIGFTLIAIFGAVSSGPIGQQVASAIWLIGFFLLRNFYFIFMESSARAATFGKRIAGLRVVARNGGRLTADAIIARNLVREVELFLPLVFLSVNAAEGSADGWMALAGLGWSGIFLLFPFFNKDRLRVGDLIAGTWVISAPKKRLSTELLDANPQSVSVQFTEEQLDAYGIYELQTLERVLRTGNADAIATVAATIRAKIDLYDNSNDVVFLNAYYDALRRRLERNLLFGNRREDKNDRKT